jgi:hypothetical protein
MMNDYLFLYEGGQMPETPAQKTKVMKAWDAWFHKIGKAMKDGGNPFTGKTKTIGSEGKVSHRAKSKANGYSIVRAKSLDAAVAIAKGCPVVKEGGKVTVYETFKIM